MISIFYKPTFININPHEPFAKRTRPIPKGRGHLLRVSSMIRADQIAERIGARLNPESGYENDICIYVKPRVRRGQDFEFAGRPYLDIIDGWDLIHLVKRHPELRVIACSKADYDTISRTVLNKVFLIPQHHCNYERERRMRNAVTRVGCIGTTGAFPFLPEGLKGELAKRNVELEEYSRFFSRQDIIDFYKRIDVQIIWRSYMKTGRIVLSNPLKMVNASSFGIPTIALDEPAFKEMEGCYIPVDTLEGFLTALDRLRADPFAYDEYGQRCIAKSEEYHIDNVAKMYLKLT